MAENKENFDDAQFNMNIAMLKRIDALFNALVDARISQNLRLCYDLTYQIEGEIEHVLEDKEIGKLNDLKKRLNEIVNPNPTIWYPNFLSPDNYRDLAPSLSELSNILITWDRKLRKLMFDKGMLSQQKGEQGLF